MKQSIDDKILILKNKINKKEVDRLAGLSFEDELDIVNKISDMKSEIIQLLIQKHNETAYKENK